MLDLFAPPKPFKYTRETLSMAKMTYNSILDVCLIILVQNLAVQTLEFDKKLCTNFTQTSHKFSHLP